MQLPASISAVAMVLSQVFFYDTILVNVIFIFIVNLVYFPLIIAALVRETPYLSNAELAQRWAAESFPGTKTTQTYMKD